MSEDKLDVAGALDAFKKYDPSSHKRIKKFYNQLKRDEASAKKALEVLEKQDPNNDYIKKVGADLDGYEKELPQFEVQKKDFDAYEAKLKEYFDAGGRKEIVDKYIEDFKKKFYAFFYNPPSGWRKFYPVFSHRQPRYN